jgi:hypothetical protein
VRARRRLAVALSLLITVVACAPDDDAVQDEDGLGTDGAAETDAANTDDPADAERTGSEQAGDADEPGGGSDHDLGAAAPGEHGQSDGPVDAEDDGADAADRDVTPRPAWLGTRPLPEREDGLGEVQPTPEELADRRLPPPPSDLPPPGDEWWADVGPVPDEVAARSTWHEGCPVHLDELAYVQLSFWGFDDRSHTGELLVHGEVVDDLVTVFGRLYEARFPIEEMRVITAEELDLPPTGDGNVTTGFVCRSTVQGQRWSDHAYGLAVDINPFHNPYVRGDAVVPELASAYLDRDDHRPGMIQPDDEVVRAFADIGWGWGGDWTTAKDWMHFSASGR